MHFNSCLMLFNLFTFSSDNMNGSARAPLPPLPPYQNGTQIIEGLGFKESNVPFDVGMLIVLDIAFRTLAFIALLIRTRKN